MTVSHMHFQKLILAEPMNDTHRMVYADWLEERGDPQCVRVRNELSLAGEIRDVLRTWEVPENRFSTSFLINDGFTEEAVITGRYRLVTWGWSGGSQIELWRGSRCNLAAWIDRSGFGIRGSRIVRPHLMLSAWRRKHRKVTM